MRPMQPILLGTFLAASCTACIASTQALRSPWDLHPVAVKAGSYPCALHAALPVNIEASSFYGDAKHSVIDPVKYRAYSESRKPYDETTRAAEEAADAFRKTGNAGAAACVLQILDTEAAGAAMTGRMSSNQAYYMQNWTLGALAICWLKVRVAQPGTLQQREAAIGWLNHVAVETRSYFAMRHAKGTNDGTNNHFYWAGLAVMGAAVSNNDRVLYDWAKGTFDEAVSRVEEDGTLPLEMDRGQRALHYHVFALSPMVMLAEFGEANGDVLYASHKGALHRLADRTLAGLRDNHYFAKKSGVAQDTPEPDGLKSSDVAWLVPYLKRFPNADGAKLLASVEVKPYDYLGGYLPGWVY